MTFSQGTAYSYLEMRIDDCVHNHTLHRGCMYVLKEVPGFQTYPASTSKHHMYEGGLMVHTAEVLKNALHIGERVAANEEILTVAALFHDVHKVLEYEFLSVSGRWVKTEYAEKIGHIAGGYGEFCSICPRGQGLDQVDEKVHDRISHVLLAHHGRKDWESLQEPDSKEAYVFHYADMLSAFYGPGANRAS